MHLNINGSYINLYIKFAELIYKQLCLYINLYIDPLSANPTKWSNTLKQFVSKLPMNCLSVFDHFVGLALKGLRSNTFFYCTMTIYIPFILFKSN